MSRSRIETEGLNQSLLTPGHAHAMYELNSDPEVIRHAEAAPVSNVPG